MLKPFQEGEDKEFDKESANWDIASSVRPLLTEYLHSRDKRLLALIIKKIEGCHKILANEKITEYQSTDDTYLVGGDFLTHLTEDKQ